MKKKNYSYKAKYAKMDVVQIRNDVRLDWMRCDAKFEAIQARAERVELPNGRLKTMIRCCGCNGLFVRSEIQAHHVEPVGKLKSTSPQDVEDYIARMFVKKNQIKPLCKSCHREVEHGIE